MGRKGKPSATFLEVEDEGGDFEGQEDLDLYDEDGILKEDSDFRDKSSLIGSVQKILDIKKKGRGTLRREAVRDPEEFVAVKRRSGPASSLNKLLESIKNNDEAKVVEKISHLVKAPSSKPLTTLETPVDRPQALRSKRSVLYEKAKEDVSRFNAIVYHNRVAEQLVYPLNSGKKVAKNSGKKESDFIPMTPLEEEMARILYGEEYVKQKKSELEKPAKPSDAEAYALSVEEALNLHSEMARLRAQQSYQMAKAKRQNKIKSKKYHRLLRKEKIKKQLKEFEELQKKDPDAAMLKLEELNKSRVVERMSLKHRNTSKWAKMEAARAKYNKDSRIALSEQLQISKQLTQKVEESSDEEDPDLELPPLVQSSLDNPWMLKPEVRDSEKLQLYYSGYKKLWEEINAKKAKEKPGQPEEESAEAHPVSDSNSEKEEEEEERFKEKDESSTEILSTATDKSDAKKSKNKKKKNKRKQTKLKDNKQIRKKKDALDDEPFTELDLDIMIEKAEDELKAKGLKALKQLTREDKLERKRLERLKRKAEASLRKSKKSKEGDAGEIRELSVKNDVQLFENGLREDMQVSKPLPPKNTVSTKLNQASAQVTIDPSKYLKISSKKLDRKNKFDGSVLNDVDFNNSEDEDENAESDPEDDQRKIIAEAFEDDDVVNEFKRRKHEEVEKSQPKDIDLTLPGWGEWGGQGIAVSDKKKKRFIKKAPPAPPRKDAKLSHVILNEEAGEGIKNHLVRELPFPFKRVEDYEKSIRAPVGRMWVPEEAMKDHTAPKIITRLGAVIEPMDEELLAKSKDGTTKELEVPLSIKRLAKVKRKK